MGDIYDFHTGQNMTQARRDYGRVADNKGRYVGMLPLPLADELRKAKSELDSRRSRVQRAQEDMQYAEDYFGRVLTEALSDLNQRRTKSPDEVLFVDDEEHCWMLPKSETEG